ncbi:hypothetical protein KIPB_008276 [Kipferlia bialata]|uniref:Uncharacterized protein n=1 Tax=Kipferlia bialata TaxID=797122 RepID=A0A9K3D248_9EUKA|nr:hypothetical protein KIPB_008276 [Kipferlia bialata]|eukprot:g8276.t1
MDTPSSGNLSGEYDSVEFDRMEVERSLMRERLDRDHTIEMGFGTCFHGQTVSMPLVCSSSSDQLSVTVGALPAGMTVSEEQFRVNR